MPPRLRSKWFDRSDRLSHGVQAGAEAADSASDGEIEMNNEAQANSEAERSALIKALDELGGSLAEVRTCVA